MELDTILTMPRADKQTGPMLFAADSFSHICAECDAAAAFIS